MKRMIRAQRFCFEASEEIMEQIESGAAASNIEPEEFVLLAIRSYFERYGDSNNADNTTDKRLYKRKNVDLPAVIQIFSKGNQVRFSSGIVLDLSLGGIKLSIPKGIEHTIKDHADGMVIEVMFKMEDSTAPAIFKCKPRRVERGCEDLKVGAEFIDGAFTCQQELYRFMT
jgi:hypothetical protein